MSVHGCSRISWPSSRSIRSCSQGRSQIWCHSFGRYQFVYMMHRLAQPKPKLGSALLSSWMPPTTTKKHHQPPPTITYHNVHNPQRPKTRVMQCTSGSFDQQAARHMAEEKGTPVARGTSFCLKFYLTLIYSNICRKSCCIFSVSMNIWWHNV